MLLPGRLLSSFLARRPHMEIPMNGGSSLPHQALLDEIRGTVHRFLECEWQQVVLRCSYVYDDVTSSTMSIIDSSGNPFSTVSPPGIDILFRQLRGELIDAGCPPCDSMRVVLSQTGHDEFRFDYPGRVAACREARP
jgi:hypothetical protein